MSDDLERLHEQLERATRPGPPAAPFDAETAALADGWAALGDLLVRAEAAQAPPRIQVRTSRGGDRRWALAAALAASLLIAAAAWKFWPRGNREAVVAEAPQTEPSRQPAAPSAAQAATEPPSSAAELTWDDPIDAELLQVRRRVILAQQDVPEGGVSVSVYARLEAIREGLNDAPL